MDYVEEAIMEKERQGMPALGYSRDRRALQHLDDVYNSDSVKQLVCLVCAQSKTDMGLINKDGYYKYNPNDKNLQKMEEPLSDIAFRTGDDLITCYMRHKWKFEVNLGFQEFIKRYAEGHAEGAGAFALSLIHI